MISKETEVSQKYKITVISVIESLCLGIVLAITITVAWFSFSSDFDFFSFHPPLFTAGYFIFTTEGFLVFLPGSSLTRGWKYHQLVKLHLILQATGFCCIVLGLTAVVTTKIIDGSPHFTDRHSITGLVAIILTTYTLCGGPIIRMGPYKRGPSMAQLKIGHVGFGLVAYAVGIANLVMGYFTQYFANRVYFEWRVFLAVITVLVACVALSNATLNFVKRVKVFTSS